MTATIRDIRANAAWSFGGAVLLRVTTFVTGIVVARLVAPDQVGVLVMVLTVQLVIISASELGISTAVARHQGSVAAIGPTATALSLGSAVVLMGLMILLAPVVAHLISVDSAAPVMMVMSITVLLAGLTSVPIGLLMREFRQRRRVIAEASGLLVGLALVPLLAGSGATGLAWTRVLGQAVSTALLIALAPARWWPRVDRGVARHLVAFGLPLVAATGLGFATTNVDFVILGAMAGAVSLGLYSLAFNVSQWSLALVVGTVNAVGLPAFAQSLDDPSALSRRISRVTQAAAAVAVPVGMLSAALAVPLVAVLYGPAWASSAPLVVLLAILALARVPLDVLGSVIVASGRSRTYLALQALQFGISVPALIVGIHVAGPQGAALSQLVLAVVIVAPAYVIVVSRGLRARLRILIAPLLRISSVGMVSAAIAWAVSRGFTSASLQLAFGLAVGGLTYIVLLRWMCRDTTRMMTIRISRASVRPT